LRSYRSANLESYRASGVVTQYKRLATHDSRVCPGCLMAEGQVSELSEVMATHPNCVIEGTLVSTPQVLGTSKRAYNGFVFDIVTIKGNHLTVTPNHPILTDKGWVAARFLKEGDNAISGISSEGTAALVAPNNQQGPTVIEDIVAAFGESINVVSVSMKVAAEDFHSDGMGSDVAVIRANRLLHSRFDAAITHPFSKEPFLVGSMGETQLLANRTLAQVVKGTGHTPDRFVGSSSVFPSLFGRSLGLHQPIRFTSATDGNASLLQAQSDHGSYCSKCGSQSVLGLSGKVTADDFVDRQNGTMDIPFNSPLFEMPIESSPSDTVFFEDGIGFNASAVVVDRIVNLSSRQFSGHVYNLQTVTGWYVANGIITHNCRCTMVPIVRGLPSPQWKQGQEWFEEQSPETQKSILGKGKYYAWQNGEFELGELVKIKPNPTWGDTLQTTTLAELTGPKVVMPVAQPVPTWKPSMSRSDAEAWAANSVVKDDTFHVTSSRGVASLTENGFDLSRNSFGRAWGDGVYVGTNQDTANLYVKRYTEDRDVAATVLPIKLNVRNPLIVRADELNDAVGSTWYGSNTPYASMVRKITGVSTNDEAMDLIMAAGEQVSGVPFQKNMNKNVSAGLSKILQDNGHDALWIRVDEVEFYTGGDQIVIFDPRNVVIVQ
jgi:hypothetical protein